MKLNCLFSKEQISRRVKELARQITRDYSNSNELFILCVLNGSIFFAADLLRELKIPCMLNCIKAKSYEGSDPAESVNISYGSDINVEGKDVLIVEDIVDTGITLKALMDLYQTHNPRSVKVCAFLDKKSRRKSDVEVDYAGFEIGDQFVVGYGMDYNGKYRELPYIGYIYSE
ncbi:MAG: hypoxanthine phosphoribosyltransferase [Oscillospiraceae bacterium]|nr:hypoxanthine phosphoribosyltransferase [Oscillospiraceae bacterium]